MEKDIAKKELERNPDVFADIFNSILFQGKEVIKEEELTELPTERYLKTSKGKLDYRFRDVLMKDTRQEVLYLLLGCENQEEVDNTMPLRCMGYDYLEYDRQVKDIMKENKKNGKGAYLQRIHKEQKLAPVVTLVMYFGKEPWNGPKDIYEMLQIPKEQEILPYVQNYQMNLVHMPKLSKDEKKNFKSDFRLVAEYISCQGNNSKLEKFMQDNQWEINHVEEFLDVLASIGKDKRYENIKEDFREEEKGEKITMCVIAEKLENRGIEKGMIKGITNGTESAKKTIIFNMLNHGMRDAEIREMVECEQSMIEEVRNSQQMVAEKKS